MRTFFCWQEGENSKSEINDSCGKNFLLSDEKEKQQQLQAYSKKNVTTVEIMKMHILCILRGDMVVQNGPKPLLSKSLGFECI